MKLSIIAFIFVINLSFNSFGMESQNQKILFFRGMSTLGKGDICQAFIQQNSQWQLVSDDDCTMQAELEFCEGQFPQEYPVIAAAIAPNNLFHAIKRSEFSYKPETSVEQKQAARRAIAHIQTTNNQPEIYRKEEREKKVKNLIKDRIRILLKNNYHVINDSWLLNESDFQEFSKDYHVIKAYCYIPLTVLITTFLKTNSDAFQTGNFKNRRSFWHILNSFERLFISEAKLTPLDSVTQEDLLNNLARIETHLPLTAPELQHFTHREMTVEELHKRREKYLARFGTHSELPILPDLGYDIIVKKKSPNDEPRQKAEELLKLIENKKKS